MNRFLFVNLSTALIVALGLLACDKDEKPTGPAGPAIGEGLVFGDAPSWSPDGRYIAFSSETYEGDRRNNNIYVMDADGSNQRRLTNHLD